MSLSLERGVLPGYSVTKKRLSAQRSLPGSGNYVGRMPAQRTGIRSRTSFLVHQQDCECCMAEREDDDAVCCASKPPRVLFRRTTMTSANQQGSVKPYNSLRRGSRHKRPTSALGVYDVQSLDETVSSKGGKSSTLPRLGARISQAYRMSGSFEPVRTRTLSRLSGRMSQSYMLSHALDSSACLENKRSSTLPRLRGRKSQVLVISDPLKEGKSSTLPRLGARISQAYRMSELGVLNDRLRQRSPTLEPYGSLRKVSPSHHRALSRTQSGASSSYMTGMNQAYYSSDLGSAIAELVEQPEALQRASEVLRKRASSHIMARTTRKISRSSQGEISSYRARGSTFPRLSLTRPVESERALIPCEASALPEFWETYKKKPLSALASCNAPANTKKPLRAVISLDYSSCSVPLKRSTSQSRQLCRTRSLADERSGLNRQLSADAGLSFCRNAVVTRRTTFSYPVKCKVALGRKLSASSQPTKRPTRRCSEPFLLDPLSLQNNKSTRKTSSNSKGHGRRKLSAAAVFPTSAKQKLRALAKDELLASLNVPLIAGEVVQSPEEGKLEDETVQVGSKEKAENERLEQKRMRVLNEILETEKNYISCLETLNLVFKNQLAAIGILTEKDLQSLFPHYLDDIKESHSWFMLELEERMRNENWRGIIGDIFAKMTSSYKSNLLGIYTNYVNAFPKSISTLSKCTRSSQKFRKFLEDCYDNPLVERLDLPSFLLSPVQRLPRYVLLLRELLKYTKDDHPDRYFVEDAMGKMQALISSLNGSIQDSMDFYAASDDKRRAMSRQFTKRSRKKRSMSGRGTFRQKLSIQRDDLKGLPDPDQGYCSFSEAKRESPDSIPSPGPEPAGYERPEQRSFSVSAGELKANHGAVLRRRKENASTSALARTTDSRKSWRRSIGAALSSLWTPREDKVMRSNGSLLSINGADNVILEQPAERGDLHLPIQPFDSVRRMSTAKRKNAIPSPMDALPRFAFSESPVLECVSDVSSLEVGDQLSPRELTAPPLTLATSTSQTDQFCEDRVEVRGDDEALLRMPTYSRMPSSSTPASPVSFPRKESLSGSFAALGRKMERNLSWQDVRKDDEKTIVSKTESSPGSSPRRARLSFRKLKFKGHSQESLKKADDNIKYVENNVKPKTASVSDSCKDCESMSSMDSESQKQSPCGSVTDDDAVDGHSVSSGSVAAIPNGSGFASDNNNSLDLKSSKEKKKKFMKSLRSLVGKK